MNMPRGRHWQRGVDVSCGSNVVDYVYMCVETKVYVYQLQKKRNIP